MQDKAVQQGDGKLVRRYTAIPERVHGLIDSVAMPAVEVDGTSPWPERISQGGQPPAADVRVMKTLLLQALYNLSDVGTQQRSLDRRS